MTIIAQIGSIEVEVVNAYASGSRKMATVKALAGEPFTNWTHGGWATSDTAQVNAEALQDVHQVNPEPEATTSKKITLLDLAKAAYKPQWASGESSWLWGNKARGAYLKNVNGFIRLYTTQPGAPGLNVYMLRGDGWGEVKDLDNKYRDWMLQLKGGAA